MTVPRALAAVDRAALAWRRRRVQPAVCLVAVERPHGEGRARWPPLCVSPGPTCLVRKHEHLAAGVSCVSTGSALGGNKATEQIGRSVGALASIGLGLVLSTLVSGVVSSGANALHLGWAGHLLGYGIAIALDVGLFVVAFRILTDREITTRDVLPGAVLSGVVFWILQSLSSLIITNYLHKAQSTYGTCAAVITLLWWFYLQSIVTLLGAQLNVVLNGCIHGRSPTLPRPKPTTAPTRRTRRNGPIRTTKRSPPTSRNAIRGNEDLVGQGCSRPRPVIATAGKGMGAIPLRKHVRRCTRRDGRQSTAMPSMPRRWSSRRRVVRPAWWARA